MIIRQLKPSEIYDFQKSAGSLDYKRIPYSKTKALSYVGGMPFSVEYRDTFEVGCPAKEANIRRDTRSLNTNALSLSRPQLLKNVPVISQLKKQDIKSMMRHMPLADRNFFESLLKIKV